MSGKYSKHPSAELNKIFSERPYQGQNPEKADFIFLGLDANFAPGIETNNFYPYIKEYLSDGIGFWKKHNVHHPFRLPQYPNGDGSVYHRNFAKLNLTSAFSEKVSFVELLDVPTVGKTNRKEFLELLNPGYIRYLENILLNNNRKKTLFISKSVLKYLESIKASHNLFAWLPSAPSFRLNNICLIFENESLRIYGVTHFSATISNQHLKQIQEAIKA